MKVHGLTGGIGSGKSTVAGMIHAAGVPLLDADRFAREVVEPGTPALAEIVATFGPEMLEADGRLARKRLGALVFGDEERRRRLNAIVHPRVQAAMGEALLALGQAGQPLAFMDIPLLYESRNPADFDSIVVVWVDGATQLRRLMARDGAGEADARARIASQLSLDEKARRADWVVDNSGELDFTRRQVDWLLARLRQEASAAQ